jgi:hypothetical protein
MLQQLQRVTGIGPVAIGTTSAYAYWEYLYDEDDTGRQRNRRWTVRVSLDEFDRMGLHPYQRVRIRLPNGLGAEAFFRGHRDFPPYTVLTFARSLNA